VTLPIQRTAAVCL